MCLLNFCPLFPSLLEENHLSQVLSICFFPWPLWLHWSLTETQNPVFPFQWFSSGFLLDGPLFLLPSGVHEMTIFVCLVLSILNTCPNHFHPLRLMTNECLFFFISALLRLTSSFVTLCDQYIFIIFSSAFMLE